MVAHRRPLPDLPSLEAVRRDYVLALVDACSGNRTQAAQILGIDRKTLYRMLRRWDPSASASASAAV